MLSLVRIEMLRVSKCGSDMRHGEAIEGLLGFTNDREPFGGVVKPIVEQSACDFVERPSSTTRREQRERRERHHDFQSYVKTSYQQHVCRVRKQDGRWA